MSIVVGLDQGGSHTWAVAARMDGRLLGLGQAGGSCHAYDGLEKAMIQVEGAVKDVLRIANLREGNISLIMAGMTGADWPDEYILLEDAIRGLGLCSRVHVTNDSLIALRGGTERSYGAVLIAGSGGNVGVRSPRGEEYHFGYFHDAEFQGGGALSAHAFRAICRAQSFRARPTLLAELFRRHFGLPTVDALVRAHFDGRLEEGSVLAPLVFTACEQGDDAAEEIVSALAQGYAEMAAAALEHFGMSNLDVEVVLSGGVFKTSSRLLRDTIQDFLHATVPGAHLVEARYEPVVGAVLLGLERLGVDTTTQAFNKHLEESATDLNLLRQVGE